LQDISDHLPDYFDNL